MGTSVSKADRQVSDRTQARSNSSTAATQLLCVASEPLSNIPCRLPGLPSGSPHRDAHNVECKGILLNSDYSLTDSRGNN